LQSTDVVQRSAVPFLVAVALTVTSSCAHQHSVGYPPSEREIAEINRAAGGRPISVLYVDPAAVCIGGACGVSGMTSAPAGPPPEIERIVSADSHQLVVVATSGERWTLPADGVLGVTTREHATGQGALAGGVLGAVIGSIAAYAAYAGSIGADQTVASYGHKPASAGEALTILVGVTTVGAVIGAIVGYYTLTFDTYQLGQTGRSVGRGMFSR
jgi:hypothetical protein